MLHFFYFLSKALWLYSVLCFIRILLTWFPKANYSSIGQILSSICDPYINLSKSILFLSYRGLNFSPALALCILFALSTILESLSAGVPLTIGYICAMLIQLAWSFVSSALKFIGFLLFIRLIVFIVMQKTARGSYSSYNPVWDQIDSFVSPLIFKISGIFFRRMVSFTKALIISVVVLWAGCTILDTLILMLCQTLASSPF